MKPKQYSMQETSGIASLAMNDIACFLMNLPCTVEVIDVENNRHFQQKDIDLIWKYRHKGKILEKKIEIKADRYHHTGNYFFETTSNASKGTPGCFLYTEADYVFYYFLDVKELHILPMPGVRDWFRERLEQFRETYTTTPCGNNEHYKTIGRLVPRHIAIEQLKSIRVLTLEIPLKESY